MISRGDTMVSPCQLAQMPIDLIHKFTTLVCDHDSATPMAAQNTKQKHSNRGCGLVKKRHSLRPLGEQVSCSGNKPVSTWRLWKRSYKINTDRMPNLIGAWDDVE